MNKKIRQFIDLLFVLVEKELRARYKNTYFGFLWVIINPIIQMLVIGFVFKFFIKQPIEYYYYFLFIGLLVWNFFSLSLTKATPAIVYERNLIKKAKFPRATIPLSIVLTNFLHLLAGLVIFTVPVFFLHTVSLMGIFYIFIALVLLMFFTIGICLLTSALNVRFRDINFFVQAFLIIWFYLNPIVYTLSMVPYKYYWLWRLNPFTSILQFLQHGFLGKPLPGIAMVSVNSLIIVAIFILGIRVFEKESKNFDDWI